MPSTPPHPCRNSRSPKRCPNLTAGQYCEACGGDKQVKKDTGERWTRFHGSATTSERGYGPEWKRFRLWFLRRHLICEASEGCRLAGTEVHHCVEVEPN